MTLYQRKLALQKLLERKLDDRAYWKAHPTHYISAVEGMASNADETELEIESLERWLESINEVLDSIENDQQKYGEKQ